jgi:hypothetical protein
VSFGTTEYRTVGRPVRVNSTFAFYTAPSPVFSDARTTNVTSATATSFTLPAAGTAVMRTGGTPACRLLCG